MPMERSGAKAINSVKWPWVISLILVILGGACVFPVFIVCICYGGIMNSFTWFLVFLPLVFLAGGLAFGIVSFAKRKTGTLPLIILSAALSIASLGLNAAGLFLGEIGKENGPLDEEARYNASLQGFLERSKGETLICSYLDGEDSNQFKDYKDEARKVLENDFTLAEIEQPYSFDYCCYLYFEPSSGGMTRLYLGKSYTTVKITYTTHRNVRLYYSLPKEKGKALYDTLKSTYETMQSEISEDVEEGKKEVTYDKFLAKMKESTSNPCYYVSDDAFLFDTDSQVLALLEGLNPALFLQKDLEIGYDSFLYSEANFVYGRKPYQNSSDLYFAAFEFKTGEIHVDRSFLDRYECSHLLCSVYALTVEESAALQAQIASIFPTA